MRIIGGKYKRRVIHPPKNLQLRPTTDMTKESLFNILDNRTELEGKVVVDLFAGTGALSYEFASRGCGPIYSIEKNYQCISFIRKTISELGMAEIIPVRSDVFHYLRSTSQRFDIIFADPPYDLVGIEQISLGVFERELLLPGGWMVIEHPKEIDLSDQQFFIEHRKYGHVNFSLFHIQSPE